MRIYISGAISGLGKQEYESRFKLASQLYEQMGCEVVNPCELEHCENASWSDYMLKDIQMLFHCDAIYMLNNWKQSKGARIEHAIAVETGKKIFYQP